MSRRRRTLSTLVLLTFLLSLWAQPLIAREPPFGREDWKFSTHHEQDFNLGDDDDHDLLTGESNISEIARWILIALYYTP